MLAYRFLFMVPLQKVNSGSRRIVRDSLNSSSVHWASRVLYPFRRNPADRDRQNHVALPLHLMRLLRLVRRTTTSFRRNTYGRPIESGVFAQTSISSVLSLAAPKNWFRQY